MVEAVVVVVAAHQTSGAFLLKCLSGGPTPKDRAPAGEANTWRGSIDDSFDVFHTSRDHAPLEIRNIPECKALANLSLHVVGGVRPERLVNVLLRRLFPCFVVFVCQRKWRVAGNGMSHCVGCDIVL